MNATTPAQSWVRSKHHWAQLLYCLPDLALSQYVWLLFFKWCYWKGSNRKGLHQPFIVIPHQTKGPMAECENGSLFNCAQSPDQSTDFILGTLFSGDVTSVPESGCERRPLQKKYVREKDLFIPKGKSWASSLRTRGWLTQPQWFLKPSQFRLISAISNSPKGAYYNRSTATLLFNRK